MLVQHDSPEVRNVSCTEALRAASQGERPSFFYPYGLYAAYVLIASYMGLYSDIPYAVTKINLGRV